MKVGEQAVYLARLKGVSRHDAIQQLKAWFEKFGIEAWWDRKVEELSKGMAQKVQFITTVLHEPEMLIFDEPFSGFDPINVELLKKEILELRKKGTTIIFSTHNMASVEEICSHIALINKSKKIIEGPINQIRNKYANNTYRLICKYQPDFHPQEVIGEEYELLSENNRRRTTRTGPATPRGLSDQYFITSSARQNRYYLLSKGHTGNERYLYQISERRNG